MSRNIEALFSVLLVELCTTVLLANAQFLPPNAPSIPGLSPPGMPQDALKCWSSLTNISGCALEVLRSIFSLQFGNIGPNCCKAFLGLEESCWPRMFPSNPSFPPLLNNSCSLRGGLVPPA
ncbi:putative Prolamin-like domain-containing protein [Rosa chinensis]|uniref:Putative Prolamin-like domain-containing protein n=1 Tax=Rosa chinensis TaxID=74649 RepID=A0A2P6RUY9_ROSCH|nr:uncharacterized protein LOC112186094 [Rosa chinensis]PRQ50250.1 putative Prolamin-like domain-containing protein [Rosa chinensis]